MQLNEFLMPEFKEEMASTRRMLAAFDTQLADYKPHEKSMSLKNLANHIADIPTWVGVTFLNSELDFAKSSFERVVFDNPTDLVTAFDKNVADAEACLAQTSNETMYQNWTMRNGETIYFTMPKIAVYRTWVMNHLIHHRAQMATYLRAAGAKVPGMYGPTADDAM